MESRTPLSVLYLHGADKEQFEVVVMIYGEGHGDLDLALCASQGVDAWTATSVSFSHVFQAPSHVPTDIVYSSTK